MDKRKNVCYNYGGGNMQLDEIKGLGPKTINILGRLGIFDYNDLISYYPYRYEVVKKTDLTSEKVIVDGVIETPTTINYLRNHKDKMSFKLNIGDKLINVVIFNRGFLKSKLNVGTSITAIGKYDPKNNMLIASDIKFKLIGDDIRIEPIYHVTTGINSNQINNIIVNAISDEIVDYVPDYLNKKYNFKSKLQCVKKIHRPDDMNLDDIKKKLKYEELFLFMLKMNYLKNKKGEAGLKRNVCIDDVHSFIDALPFKLTNDQVQCVHDIYDDLISHKRMNRLLQGDVGSGKTIVSFIALYINYLSGYQGALMVPTEVLAIQHYNSIRKLLPNLNIALLTGKLKASEKKKIYSNLSSGAIDIIIGTHALISTDVHYHNLGLVITDEQHRFGVNQRNSLRNKGIMPDVLYMSATPIPRTYAITLFGDMDISSIKTKPAGRKEIISYLKKDTDIKDVLQMMYDQIKLKHQIYVIAPLIEESDKIELENVIKLKDKMELAFGKVCKVGLMHGKLSSKEKDEVMDKFKNNEIQILISTTVIEVGVDVPNATMMVVFDSYRFGLSALHQLRGRVGRNDLQSYFVMISNSEATRLKVLLDTTDGFKISEADFKLRGSGDVFGVRQSGDMQFKIADLKSDFDLLLKAKEDSLDFLNHHISEYSYIAKTLERLDNLD